MLLARRITAFALLLVSALSLAAVAEVPRRLKVGTSIQFKDITPEKIRHAKSVGIDYIEVSLGSLMIDTTGESYAIQDKDQVIQQLRLAKEAADAAGITIWSVH